MAAGSGFDYDDAAVRARIRTAIRNSPRIVERALNAETEVLAVDCARVTPVETGVLKGTVRAVPAERSGDTFTSGITAGSPGAEEYAWIVHERLDVHHPVGMAKFIERPVMTAAPFFPSRVASRISLEEMVGR